MKTHKKPLFRGCATALITPFSEDKQIDYPTMERLLFRQADAGVSAILIAGTTGEGATLSDSEKCALTAFAKKTVSHIPIIGNAGSNNTSHAVSLAKRLADAGADALLVVTPYYNKASDRGLVLHYQAVSEATDLPLIVYHVPSRTGCRISEACFGEIAKIKHVKAVKEASGDLTFLEHIIKDNRQTDFYTGNDDQTVGAMKRGAIGSISVFSNLFPEETVRLTSLCLAGKWEEAATMEKALLPRMRALFAEVNPIPVKSVAAGMGLCREEYRLPLCPPAKETKEQLNRLF